MHNPETSEDETFTKAAIQGEYETGRREKTEAGAKAHVAVRMARMTAGTIVTLVGLAMMPMPGPGLPVLAIGLAILARDVAWAVGILRRMGLWAFSTDYRSSNRRTTRGAPVGEYADRIMIQTNYQIGPGLSVGVAGFYSEQRDVNDMIWHGKGGTVGLKVFF